MAFLLHARPILGRGNIPPVFITKNKSRSLCTTIARQSKRSGGDNFIRPSPSEIASSRLNPRNLETAVRGMHEDGLVVVEDVIPHDKLDHLNGQMVRDALELQSRGEDGPFNYNLGNIQLDAPPWAEFFDPVIFTNRIATQITSSILGPRPKWTFCSANAAMPPSSISPSPTRQPVHSDADFAHPTTYPFALVVNVPLIDMTPRNGATEIWPGTHRVSSLDSQEGMEGQGGRGNGRIRQHVLDAWVARNEGAVQQPSIKKGSIVIRDLRLWHAGMPNLSEGGEVRVMLAFIHFAAWFRNRMRLEFAEDIRPLLLERHGEEEESGGLDVSAVDWIGKDEAEKKYLGRGFGNSYDFSQEE